MNTDFDCWPGKKPDKSVWEEMEKPSRKHDKNNILEFPFPLKFKRRAQRKKKRVKEGRIVTY